MPPAKTRATKPTAGAKQQQTIADSLRKSALRRKDKAARPVDEDDGEGPDEGRDPEDEEMVDATEPASAGAPLPKRTSRSRTAATTNKTPSARSTMSVGNDSEREEKSEERGPRRGRSSAGTQHKRGSDRDVLTGSFLIAAGNASDLSRRLKQTWAALQQTANQQHDADVPLEKLRLVCSELLHDKIMENTEKNVRSLAACCFVELLRVYAPDMPFKSNEELYDAFQLILEQLRCLAIESHDENGAAKTASSTDLHHLYVLESLASVKSFVLLIGMDYVPDESDEPLLVQLFRTLFNTIRKEHSIKIENLMLSIMTTCIEESDSIEQNLLDVILSPLIHANPHVDMSGANDLANVDSVGKGPYHMAQELIRRTSDHLQSHLSHFFNSVLVDAPTTFMSKASELKEHVYTLIYEVHKVNSSLLLYVLPNVCMQLQVDEVATRSEAIALMGRLFASSHAEYGHDYMKNFRDFLGRFRDVSKEIRLQMVQVSAIIWQRKAELGPLIEKECISRLADPEWEVRRLVVNEVCDLAANNIEAVGEDCLRQVGERMKDKRVILRKEAMTGLSQVYAAHISSYWAPEGDEDDEEDNDLSLSGMVPSSNAKKLGWVPDFVLKCFAYPQQELKLRVIQLLDDILLPKAFNDKCRAKGLLYIYHSLDSTAREALRRIFVERAKCQSQVRSFLRAKRKSRMASTNPVQATDLMNAAMNSFHVAIRPLFNETDNLSKLIDQLASWKDQTVFKQLELLCDCSKSQQDHRSARDRLVKAVGSKSPLGDFLKNFCRKLNLLTVGEGTVGAYLRFFVGNGLPHHRENRSVTELLLVVARTTPQLFARFVQREFETIMTQNDDSSQTKVASDDEDDDDIERDNKVIVSLLNALAHFSEHWKNAQLESDDVLSREATDAVPSEALKNYLKQCCLGLALKNTTSQEDGAAAKFSAQILANFFGQSKDIGTLISKLCSKKVLVAPSAPTAISTLLSLHIFSKRCPAHLSQHPDNVSSLWRTLMENYIRQENESKNEATKQKKNSKAGYTAARAAEVRCLAIKVAADLLVSCHDRDSVNLAERGRELIKLLFDLLRSDGKMWTSTGSLPVKYRVSAASNILKLLRHRTIENSLAMPEWHILGFVIQDSAEDVRRAFVKKLSANLMKTSIPHPHKYLSYLVLAATESNVVIKKSVRGLLIAAIERMRRVFQATSSHLANEPGGDGDEEDRQNASALMVPEYALPYVIHLLAHHPDFPSTAAKKFTASGQRGSLVSDPLWSEQIAYLDFFIEGLMPTNITEADNIAFLLQILTKLSDCHDSSDPHGVAIYPLIECAVVLLKRRIKNQSNLKSFPGKIYLPKQLYTTGKAPERRLSLKTSRPDEAQDESDAAFDPPAKKSRISASLSPIKPSGTLSTFMNMKSPPLSAQKSRSSPVNASTPRRRSLVKSPASSTIRESVDEEKETPSRRQSLMRRARSQAKTFVADSESDEDDPDKFVLPTSVASRANKRDASSSKPFVQKTLDGLTITDAKTPIRHTSPKRGRSPAHNVDEETKGGSDMDVEAEREEEMTSFRASRRRQRS